MAAASNVFPPLRKLALIGLGPHAQKFYFPELEAKRGPLGLELQLVVDLESARTGVEKYLSSRFLAPRATLFLPDAARHSRQLPVSARRELDRLVAEHELDALIVASEPSSHFAYLSWAAANGIGVLVDKPVTANAMSTARSAKQLWTDYQRLTAAFRASGARAAVMLNRRGHPAFQFAKSLLRDVMDRSQIGITYLDCYHANGIWYLPEEILARENHPYKYGYGALLHGGFHPVDTAMWFLELNKTVASAAKPDRICITSQHTSPLDFFAQVGSTAYQRLFNEDMLARIDQATSGGATLGECDISILFQLLSQERVLTSGAVTVLQTAYSTRASNDLLRPSYRVAHDRVNIQVGHLLNCQLRNCKAPGSDDPDTTATVVNIYRNSALIGGQPYHRETFPSVFGQSAFTVAKRNFLERWLAGSRAVTTLEDLAPSIQFEALVQESILRGRAGKSAALSRPFDIGPP